MVNNQTCILYVMNMHIPQVKIKSQSYPRWYNADIRHHLNCLRILRKKSRLHPTHHNLSKSQISETQLQDKMVVAKSAFEARLIDRSSKENTSSVYNYNY